MTNPHPTQRAEGTTADAAPTPSSQPVRIFVGIKVAPDLARQLALLAKREHVPFRYVPVGDIHLTLVPRGPRPRNPMLWRGCAKPWKDLVVFR
jgi:hypothetical protein